jgi:AcrR family transcriptional regulator
MKTKTESKRQAIIPAAAEVFREVGFDRASMSDIRERIGGSKATLYNYFPSKEKLFFEVMHHAKEVELEAITSELDTDADDVKRELVRFGQKFMTVLYSADAIAVRRLAIAESRHSDIGKLSFEQATVPIEKQVAEFLKKVMKGGAANCRPEDRRDSPPEFAGIGTPATGSPGRNRHCKARESQWRGTSRSGCISLGVRTPLARGKRTARDNSMQASL